MTAARTVVLLHGLWVPGPLLLLMRRRVCAAGYDARIYSYPSMRLTLAENAARLREWCRALPTVPYFIAHSMGGLVVLRMLCGSGMARTRVVVAGTPFADCHAARRLRTLPGGSRLLGRSMAEWLDVADFEVDVAHEVGVIAGTLGAGLGKLIAPGLSRPHDGVVAVRETAVPGARDHLTMNVAHSAMLFSPEVARQACCFLRDGVFDHHGSDHHS